MDAFSEILSGVKMHGAVFFTAEFSAPWGLSMPAANVMAAKSPCQNLDFREGRNLGEFGRTLSERKDLIGKCL